jgi:lauroyl/myristoyl acyltransferase
LRVTAAGEHCCSPVLCGKGWDSGCHASLAVRATDDRRLLSFSFSGRQVLGCAVLGRSGARAADHRSRKVSMPGLKDRLTDAGYGLGWSVVCRLPESWAQSAFRFSADLAWRRQGPGVQVLEGNLHRVIGVEASGGQLRALSRQAMRSYARYWLEAFRLPVMPVERLVGGMRDTGHIETAFEYLAAGRGVVFALPHMGNYDLACAWIVAKGAGSVTAVVERVKPESVYDRFVAFREGLGMEVLPASGGMQRFGILVQRLGAGKIVGLICDRDLTGGGMEVEFFGEKARMMGGPGRARRADRRGADARDLVVRGRWLGRACSCRLRRTCSG